MSVLYKCRLIVDTWRVLTNRCIKSTLCSNHTAQDRLQDNSPPSTGRERREGGRNKEVKRPWMMEGLGLQRPSPCNLSVHQGVDICTNTRIIVDYVG